jgi:hypothetical protein
VPNETTATRKMQVAATGSLMRQILVRGMTYPVYPGVASTVSYCSIPNRLSFKASRLMRSVVRHVMARGHETETRRGSARDHQTRDSSQYYNTYPGYYASSSQQQQTTSWGSRGSSGGDDRYQDDQQAYYYDYDYDYDYDHDYDPNTRDGSSYRT